MHNKKIIQSSVTVLLGVALLGGSLAWFVDRQEKNNVFATGKVDVDLRENEDGATTGIQIDGIVAGTNIDKRVDVRVPQGTSDTLIRIEFAQKLLKNGEEVNDSDGIFSTGVDGYSEFKPIFAKEYGKYWIQDANNKNVYYYNKVVNGKSGEVITEDILKSVELTGKAGNSYQGLDYTIDIKADAIQATNKAYESWVKNTPFENGNQADQSILDLLKTITANIDGNN